MPGSELGGLVSRRRVLGPVLCSCRHRSNAGSRPGVRILRTTAIRVPKGCIDCSNRDIRRELTALRRTLVERRDAGTPWRARQAAEILAMLDMTAWTSVLGLLDECPPAVALTAPL